MAKKGAARLAKKGSPPTGAERQLAERLFVKFYDLDRGKTPEHFATEAVKAAKAFSTVCPPSTEE